jgi:hypothetical protein
MEAYSVTFSYGSKKTAKAFKNPSSTCNYQAKFGGAQATEESRTNAARA